jgi:hypothetical protein
MAVVAPPMPYGYLWEIFFAVILAISCVLAIKYRSFGKRWIIILFAVGIAEMGFSTITDGYSILVAGLVIGLVTAYSGFIIPALYWAKLPLRRKRTKIAFILSGCLELLFGYVGVVTAFSFGVNPFFLYFGLLTIGFYSIIVGSASLFFAKPKSLN